MPLFPQFQSQYTQQVVTDTFGGYNHLLRIPDGEWYDTKNMTTDFSPMLANRKKRGTTDKTVRGVIEKKSLAYIGSDGYLYFNFNQTGLSGLTSGEKQMVSMGAYICIFPDKKYINTEDLTDYGSMEATYTKSATYQLCRYDGTVFSATTSNTAPVNPANGDYWIDTSGETHILKQWSDSQGDWISIETVYIKITFSDSDISNYFSDLDGVTISGSSIEDVNGDKVIYDIGTNWIMVTGLADTIPADAESITLARSVPDLDYVCECQNRLWGCYYGMGEDGKAINEIYCSALGDFKNWRQYQGLSTDSWTGSVGSDGQWTGAVNYLGYPTFFKENRIHRVTVSTEGAHRLDETVCRGVQKGSAKSLVVVNETLYYKSPSDICAYQGGFPVGVSSALGNKKYHAAAAGAIGGKYYISMLDESDNPFLFVYDINKGIWIHEDNFRGTDFARVDDELYAVNGEGTLCTMLGSTPTVGSTQESKVQWHVISGVEYYEYPSNKIRNSEGLSEISNMRVSRYNIRMKMAEGARVWAYVRYDDDITDDLSGWIEAGQITAGENGIKNYVLPIRTHRCDHMQFAIKGEGDVRIYSISRVLEAGSDYR